MPDWLNVVDRRGARAQQACGAARRLTTIRCWPASRPASCSIMPTTPGSTRPGRSPSCRSTCARRLRDALPDDEGFRPHFLGHILVEILLDAALIDADPAELEPITRRWSESTADAVETAVEPHRAAPGAAAWLGSFRCFRRERFLWDYLRRWQTVVSPEPGHAPRAAAAAAAAIVRRACRTPAAGRRAARRIAGSASALKPLRTLTRH